MSGDLTGEDAFNRLLEVALESRVQVRHAEEARDRAQRLQNDAERMAQGRLDNINKLVLEKAAALPKLSALWIAADRLRLRVANNGETLDAVEELNAALAAACEACDQIPF